MEPVVLLQSYLDDVATALLADDWPAYRRRICLPCAVISHDESKLVTTEEDLRLGFDIFRDIFRAQRVTDYIRLVDQAHQLDLDLIAGSYVSHVIAGGHRVIAPYRSIMVLRLEDDVWRAASVTNGLANSRWPLVRRGLSLNPEGPK